MSGILFLAILSAIIFIGFIVWYFIDGRDSVILFTFMFLFFLTTFTLGTLSIVQPILVKEIMFQANLNREQIQYQITLVEEDPAIEKVKLNEWILTYNNWINKINTNKEVYGWFAWYYNADMSEHTYIPLV